MNLPNKLTLMRVFLVPVFLAFLLLPITEYHLFIALFIFVVAALTDLFDGNLARRNNQITDFGKLMDPLADKLIVTAALVGFVQINLGNAWIAMIIIARELLVTSIRLIAVNNKGAIIPANFWGKIKTISQMTAIIIVMLFGGLGLPPFYGQIFLWISVVFTVISGIQYVWVYRGYIDIKK